MRLDISAAGLLAKLSFDFSPVVVLQVAILAIVIWAFWGSEWFNKEKKK